MKERMKYLIIKTGLVKIYKFFLAIESLFASKTITMNQKEAFEFLNSKQKYRDCTIETQNEINPCCDLMIVVPAYNVEKYINPCIESILSQKTSYTYKIVAVDDGSTDATGKLLDEFNDTRIRVIHQENKGIASARNAALVHIIGKYIMFVDSDDLLLEGAIEALMNKAIEFDADIVEGGSCFVNAEGERYSFSFYEESKDAEDYADNLRGMPWGKVIRSSIFERIKYPDTYDFEDSIFAYCIYPKTKRKYTIKNCFYGYRKIGNSISKLIKKSEKAIDTYYISLALWEYYTEHFPVSKEFNIGVLGQIAINHHRTKGLGCKVLEAGFVLQRNLYMEIFANTQYLLEGKYKKLDAYIRSLNYGKYDNICKAWWL